MKVSSILYSIGIILAIANLAYISYVDYRNQQDNQAKSTTTQYIHPDKVSQELIEKGLMEWPHQ